MKKMIFTLFALLATAVLGAGLTGCSDDGDGGGKKNGERNGAFFISVLNEEGTAEYLIQTDDVNSGELSITDRFDQLEMSGYTWIFNTDPSVAVGLIYNKGEAGVGLGYGVNSSGELYQIRSFQISDRFTTYGFFENYAVTMVGGQTPSDDDSRSDGVIANFLDLSTFSRTSKYMPTLDVFADGEQATFSGVVDLGNGTFMTGVVVSQARDESATGGSSTGTINNPDQVWVAILDSDLNVVKKFKDEGRISYSSGRYRSQYYSQIGKTDDGTVYIFSGSYDYNNEPATTVKAGALKLNGSLDGFDPNYHFDIESKTVSSGSGYRFRKVWYITGHYFLLELYNHTGRLTDVDDPATQYAVVDMASQTFKWLTNFPAKDQIVATGLPMAYNGKMYFPITIYGENPTLYIIDPATAAATKGLSVYGASKIGAVGRVLEE